MPSVKVPYDLNNGTYFLTFVVQHWYHIFNNFNRWEILSDSFMYCIDNKDLKLEAFVFMLNHIHLIVSSPNVAGFICDFKKFTSKRLKENILTTQPALMNQFIDRRGDYHLWQKTNMPKYIETEDFYQQKLDYIHYNPVVKSYVALPEQWYWSSANPNCELRPTQLLQQEPV